MAEVSEPSVTSLVGSALSDTQSLLSDQIELTKLELTQSARVAAKSSTLFVAAAFLAVFAFGFLLVAAAYGLVALGLDVWAGFLIVALLLAVVTAILGLMGKRQAGQIKGPERSKAAMSATSAVLSRSGK